MRHYFAVFLIAVIFMAPWAAENFPHEVASFGALIERAGKELAAVILSHNPISVAELQQTYTNATDGGSRKVRILVVPGHEPDYGGAEYGTRKERNMTVELAQDLIGFLRQN